MFLYAEVCCEGVVQSERLQRKGLINFFDGDVKFLTKLEWTLVQN